MEKKDSKPHSQDPLPSKEKENRRFALKFVFVGIIGFSLIVGILKFRQAKEAISKRTSQENIVKSFEGRKLSSDQKETASKREPSSSLEQRDTAGPLLKLKREKRWPGDGPRDRRKVSTKEGEITLGTPLEPTARTPYHLVESLVAVKADLRDQFSRDDILGEKGTYLLVSVKEAKGLPQLPVVYNQRTRALGFLTGVLSIKFENEDVFQNRFNYFDSDLVERRAFAPIALSLVEVDSIREASALSQRLRELKTFWQGVPGVSKVTIEIIEHEKSSK